MVRIRGYSTKYFCNYSFIHHQQIYKYFPPPVIMKGELARLATGADHQTRAHQDHAGGAALRMSVKLRVSAQVLTST